MNQNEFRELGYLQEANRRFFHPLGLALAIDTDQDDISLSIIDSRNDKEGFIFDEEYLLKNIDRFRQKKEFIDKEIEKRAKERIKMFGWVIQKIQDQFSKKGMGELILELEEMISVTEEKLKEDPDPIPEAWMNGYIVCAKEILKFIVKESIYKKVKINIKGKWEIQDE